MSSDDRSVNNWKAHRAYRAEQLRDDQVRLAFRLKHKSKIEVINNGKINTRPPLCRSFWSDRL